MQGIKVHTVFSRCWGGQYCWPFLLLSFLIINKCHLGLWEPLMEIGRIRHKLPFFLVPWVYLFLISLIFWCLFNSQAAHFNLITIFLLILCFCHHFWKVTFKQVIPESRDFFSFFYFVFYFFILQHILLIR